MPAGKNTDFQSWKTGRYPGLENEDKHGLGMRLVGEPGNHRSKGFEDGISIPVTPGIAAIETVIGKYDPEVPFRNSPKPFSPEADSGVGSALKWAVQLREWDMGHHRQAKETWGHASDPTYQIALAEVARMYRDLSAEVSQVIKDDRWPLRDFDGTPNPPAAKAMERLQHASALRSKELMGEFLEIRGQTMDQYVKQSIETQRREAAWQQQRSQATSPER